MDLVKQVCTLEQAKKLKELGIEQESYFYWADTIDCAEFGLTQGHFFLSDKEYSAFTTSELGVMLPEHPLFHTQRVNPDWIDEKISREPSRGKWVGYSHEKDYPSDDIEFNSEAEARAYILIMLLENNHTTPEEVNTRLNNQ